MAEPENTMTDTSPWHPDYGLGDDIRMAAIREAERTSARDAAEMFNVHVTTVRLWRRRLRVTRGV